MFKGVSNSFTDKFSRRPGAEQSPLKRVLPQGSGNSRAHFDPRTLDDLQWPSLSTLSALPEADRRRVLLSRIEEFGSKEKNAVMELRQDLEIELNEISIIELLNQTVPGFRAGINIPQNLRSDKFSEVLPLTDLVGKSPSFTHYLNTFLYFSVRFAAGRRTTHYSGPAEHGEKEFNYRPVGLPSPPLCEGLEHQAIRKAVESFVSMRDRQTPNVREALSFIDDYLEYPDESIHFELWLRGLYVNPEREPRFRRLALSLYQWAHERVAFYRDLEDALPESRKHLRECNGTGWKEGEWQVTNPLAARFGLADFRWLARILRADVSPRAVVHYKSQSWLSYLSSVAFLPVKDSQRQLIKQRILGIEEVLRSIFDFACDFIQNAVEMAEYCEHKDASAEDYPERAWTEDWRAAFDRELIDVSNQRKARVNLDQRNVTPSPVLQGDAARAGKYWSKRIVSGESEQHLIGLALSGGGTRSATFGLGILEGLKELDLLRHIDYLSTVSGGGYIGAWLVGNVRRTHYWLSRMTSWDESIGHLRRYSKYLAPQAGLLSADTWVIWGTWIRNAFVSQLNVVAWLAALIVLALAMKPVFAFAGKKPLAPVVLVAVVLALLFILIRNLRKPNHHLDAKQWLAVGLAWFGSFITAALLWSVRDKIPESYSKILRGVSKDWTHVDWTHANWTHAAILLSVVPLFFLALVSFWPKKRVLGSIGVAILSMGVIYLALCAVLYLFRQWTVDFKPRGEWYAYVFGPPLVLLSMAVAVLLFIGLIAGVSADWKREWWTRYGSWLAMYGTGFMALNLAAVFGPIWVYNLWHHHWAVRWGPVIAWLGSTLAGLMAGHSEKTKGNGRGSSRVLEIVAKLGGFVFITGSVLAISSLLFLVMFRLWGEHPDLNCWENWWQNLNDFSKLRHFYPSASWITFAVLLVCGLIFSWRFNLNIFGLNEFYRNRLVRCYLGATRWKPGWRVPEGFTGFDDKDDLYLSDLQFCAQVDGECFRGPFPIVNCSLNLGGSSDLSVHTRQSASFTLTPLSAGADRPRVGYAPIRPLRLKSVGAYAGSPKLGQAISISGAAASPNMGYNTSPLVSVLLTMFNVRLGWWLPNPGEDKWQKDSPVFSLSYLLWEFLGHADEKSNFVNVSDGGHFENLGIYELVRRRAKVIIASDAEHDPDLNFGSLGNLIRICETDFGAKIDLDVKSIAREGDNEHSHAHCAVGRITYSNGSLGYLIYLKASMTGDEDVAIKQYRSSHPDFPHQSTSDQFFTEDQFESYRYLGRHIAAVTFRGVQSESKMVSKGSRNVVGIAGKLYDLWAPAGFSSATFTNHAKALDILWERFRTSPILKQFLLELVSPVPKRARTGAPNNQELCACVELLQLMENIFLDLRLDDFWEHPDNRGWAILFTMWAKSPTLRAAWEKMRRTFGLRFEYFCGQRLGLPLDQPVVRI